MLIKRIYEVAPLPCRQCGGKVKVVTFIEPPQGAVIEKILRHCGLLIPSTPRTPLAQPLGWATWTANRSRTTRPGN